MLLLLQKLYLHVENAAQDLEFNLVLLDVDQQSPILEMYTDNLTLLFFVVSLKSQKRRNTLFVFTAIFLVGIVIKKLVLLV